MKVIWDGSLKYISDDFIDSWDTGIVPLVVVKGHLYYTLRVKKPGVEFVGKSPVIEVSSNKPMINVELKKPIIVLTKKAPKLDLNLKNPYIKFSNTE